MTAAELQQIINSPATSPSDRLAAQSQLSLLAQRDPESDKRREEINDALLTARYWENFLDSSGTERERQVENLRLLGYATTEMECVAFAKKQLAAAKQTLHGAN